MRRPSYERWGGKAKGSACAPFRQLTHCVCESLTFSIEDVLSFLATAPLIQELLIKYIRVPSNLVLDLSPILLPHLRILTVYSKSISIHSMFSKIICPSLNTLHIYHHDPSFFDLLELLSFLHRSKCQFKSLEIIGNVSEGALEELIMSNILRSVTCLQLNTEDILDRIVLVFMMKTKDGLQILPQLEDLTLLSCETTDGLLAKMISSRLDGTRGLLRDCRK